MIEDLELQVKDWAARQADVLAVIVVGSQARRFPPADEYSDLDLVFFVTSIDSFLSDPTWLYEIGPVLVHHFDLDLALPEWFALFEDGLKLDIAFVLRPPQPLPSLRELLQAFPYQDVLKLGVRVLLANTNDQEAQIDLQAGAFSPDALPDQEKFRNHLMGYWLAAQRVIKFTQRNDLWRAASVCNCELKKKLLVLLEWRARSEHPEMNTWYDGRFLSEWAGSSILAELPATFARYDAEDLGRAALASYDLANRLGIEIAGKIGLQFPHAAEQKMRPFLTKARNV